MIIQRKKVKVNKSNSKGDGFKVSMPKRFAEVLDVDFGDLVEWRLNVIDGRVIITVVKFEE